MDISYEIEQVIRAHISGFGKSGPDNIMGRCPFHRKADGSEEKSPSFAMSTRNGLYFCHSCGAKGNLYTFFRDLGIPRQEITLQYQNLIDAAKDNLSGPINATKAEIYDKEYMVWGLPPREGWQRSNVLYNGHRLYGLYHQREPVDIVLVEGFKACMWVHQAGFSNCGALLGHYMTAPQRWIIEGLAGGGGGTVYMFLDNNWQGWHGCETAGLQLAKSVKVKVCMYPARLRDDDKAQPDSCTPEELW